ncbi:Non-heme 11 kDa protein of cytochrome bc1 complex [Lyophyllum atratum]|nr:Non-heme 11 kDa protein of cytochrome bc1 complex [Lyophyllum atratum]
MSSSISSFFSSFLPVVYADSEEKPEQAEESPEPQQEEADAEEPKEEEGGEEKDPEDPHPIIREECKETPKCAPFVKHFEHCQEKVSSGHGFKGEDCVEEFMMHCVDDCTAPRLFSKLR